MNCEAHAFESGLVCLHTCDHGAEDLKQRLSNEVSTNQFNFALIYYSKSRCSAHQITTLMQDVAELLPYAACSTAGELTPIGLDQGQLVILLFPRQHFAIQPMRLTTTKDGRLEDIVSHVNSAKKGFVEHHTGHGTIFALCLMDGASFMEEAMTAAIHWGLEDVPVLGGSAGDELNFLETDLILNGEVLDDNGILMLVHTDLPVEIFKTENFVPSSQKLVVTRSDPDHRIVHELNAAPAALAYAEVIGADLESLTPQSFASHPLVMRVGGEYYCRSIQKVNDDNSLSFFCAIDDGIVLTVAEQTGMARTTKEALDGIRDRLGEIDFVLGFDCVLRQIDARNRQVTHRISEIYRDFKVLGFNTYGEQYRSLHLNQTLTGVAFGTAVPMAEAAE